MAGAARRTVGEEVGEQGQGSAHALVCKAGFFNSQTDEKPGRGMSRAVAGFDSFCTKCTLEEDWGVCGRRHSIEGPYKSHPGRGWCMDKGRGHRDGTRFTCARSDLQTEMTA